MLILAAMSIAHHALGADRPDESAPAKGGFIARVEVLTLQQCVDRALQRNHRRPASQFEVAMAEAQHRQALAGYWPQVKATAAYQLLDQPMNFIVPASAMQIPAQSIAVPGGSAMVTIPANAFGPGFPPAAVQMPVTVPNQTVATPAQAFTIPEQNIKLLDRNFVTGSVDMTWPVFDGGTRRGYREQSGGWLDMMRAEARRTDLEISGAVKRYYWGAVLARQLHQVGNDTLNRMETTLRLTENLFKEGAGKVTKTDFLENQVMVESLRSLVADLDKNEMMSQAALANSVGESWDASVQPADPEIPFVPYAGSLDDLVSTSYQFSPDWAKVEAAIRASEGLVTTARSGYYPKVAITGELHRWWNGGYDDGVATPQNKAGWSVGVGLEFPLFDGFLTRNKVSEAVARLSQLKENRLLLRDGLGLQIKDLVMGLDAAAKSHQATLAAMRSAADNRDLNERAYKNDLVETEKVVRAQMVEALMSAQHYKACYDYAALLSQLNVVVGTEVRGALTGPQK